MKSSLKAFGKVILVLISLLLLYIVLLLAFPGDLESFEFYYNLDGRVVGYGMLHLGDYYELGVYSTEAGSDERVKIFSVLIDPLAAKDMERELKEIGLSNRLLYNDESPDDLKPLNISMNYQRRQMKTSLESNQLPKNINEINTRLLDFYYDEIINSLYEPYLIEENSYYILKFALSDREEVTIDIRNCKNIFHYSHKDYFLGGQKVELDDDELRDYLRLLAKSLEHHADKQLSGGTLMLQQGDDYNALRYKTYEAAQFGTSKLSDNSLYQMVVNNEYLYPLTVIYDVASIDEAIVDLPNEFVSVNGTGLSAPFKSSALTMNMSYFISEYAPKKSDELFRGFIPKEKTQLEFIREYPKENLKWIIFGCHADNGYVLIYGGNEYPEGWVEDINRKLINP